jgi:hypothetical protein
MAKNGSRELTLKVYEDRRIPRKKRNVGAKYVQEVCPFEWRSVKPLLAMLRRRASSNAIIVAMITTARASLKSG